MVPSLCFYVPTQLVSFTRREVRTELSLMCPNCFGDGNLRRFNGPLCFTEILFECESSNVLVYVCGLVNGVDHQRKTIPSRGARILLLTRIHSQDPRHLARRNALHTRPSRVSERASLQQPRHRLPRPRRHETRPGLHEEDERARSPYIASGLQPSYNPQLGSWKKKTHRQRPRADESRQGGSSCLDVSYLDEA